MFGLLFILRFFLKSYRFLKLLEKFFCKNSNKNKIKNRSKIKSKNARVNGIKAL